MRAKLVILHRTSTAFDAARAMQDNHVGSVLVVDARHHLVGIVTDRDLAMAITRADFSPRETPLSALMTDVVGACEEGARHADLVCAMKQFACRRVPITREGRPVGLVTFDDLLVEGALEPADAREIVAAQLALPSRLKPAGSLRPGSEPTPDGPQPSERRLEAKREQALRDLAGAIETCPGIGTRERAETALRITLGMLLRRLQPDDARALTDALPASMREHVAAEGEAPGEPITADVIGAELDRRLALPPDSAVELIVTICDGLAEIAPARDGRRIRWPIGELFPRARL